MADIYEQTAARRFATPQMEQARGDEVKNNAGGYVFDISDLARAKRFLVLGTDAGTYYQKTQELTRENAEVLQRMADSDDDDVAEGLVNLIIDVSVRGIAPKVQPTLFALAIAANGKNVAGRAAAKDAVDLVVRTGSHLLTYIRYLDLLGGWSRGKRGAINAWYESKDASWLAYQFVKYFQREGWGQRDVLRVTHPKVSDPAKKVLFDWVTKKNVGDGLPALVTDFLTASGYTPADKERLITLIGSSQLSWEMLPDWAHTDADIWKALLLNNRVPLTALIRNLSRLTELKVIDIFGSQFTDLIIAKLTDEEQLRKARIHPLSILIAAKTYKKGETRGGKVFTPSTAILDALDSAFYLAFGSVEAAGKRTLVGLDISGSMDQHFDPSGILTAREAGTAMALVLAATEPWTQVFGFTSQHRQQRGYYGFTQTVIGDNTHFTPLNISGSERLDSLIARVRDLPLGRTDCSLPMREALKNDWDVDTFVIITDNETWDGPVHPWQALRDYRRSKQIRKDAKLIVLSVTASDFSIADPKDPLGQLDICGFGSDVPQLVAAFSKGF